MKEIDQVHFDALISPLSVFVWVKLVNRQLGVTGSTNLLIAALSLSLMDFWNFRCLFDLFCISRLTNPDCYFNESCCLQRLCSTFEIF